MPRTARRYQAFHAYDSRPREACRASSPLLRCHDAGRRSRSARRRTRRPSSSSLLRRTLGAGKTSTSVQKLGVHAQARSQPTVDARPGATRPAHTARPRKIQNAVERALSARSRRPYVQRARSAPARLAASRRAAAPRSASRGAQPCSVRRRACAVRRRPPRRSFFSTGVGVDDHVGARLVHGTRRPRGRPILTRSRRGRDNARHGAVRTVWKKLRGRVGRAARRRSPVRAGTCGRAERAASRPLASWPSCGRREWPALTRWTSFREGGKASSSCASHARVGSWPPLLCEAWRQSTAPDARAKS